MAGAAEFVNEEQHIPYVHHDVATDFRIVKNIAHGAFPLAVEIEADEVAGAVDHGAPGVAAGGVVGADKADGHFAFDPVRAVIFPIV